MPKATHDHSNGPSNLPAVITNDPTLADFLHSEAVEEGMSALPLLIEQRERQQERAMRLMPVEDDSMEPTLRKGDAVAVVPADKFTGDGVYVIDVHGYPRVYRCAFDWRDGVDMLSDNKAIPPQKISRDDFARLVIGRVAMVCNWIYRPC